MIVHLHYQQKSTDTERDPFLCSRLLSERLRLQLRPTLHCLRFLLWMLLLHIFRDMEREERSVPSNIREKAIAKILLGRFCSTLSAVTNMDSEAPNDTTRDHRRAGSGN